ncbi:MAG: hypothetical protein GF411_08605 [Candidatus Lokiarchaeota archaeon]|nr:hypothetical protein [Candidatus Lokiarchaeota archaeon]
MTKEEQDQFADLIYECKIRELNNKIAIERAYHALKNTPDLPSHIINLLEQSKETLRSVEDLKLVLCDYSFNKWCKDN